MVNLYSDCPRIPVQHTQYLGRTARGQDTISTRLEPLKPRPQPGGAELVENSGIVVPWALQFVGCCGVVLPTGWDIFPTAFQLVAANYPIPHITTWWQLPLGPRLGPLLTDTP